MVFARSCRFLRKKRRFARLLHRRATRPKSIQRDGCSIAQTPRRLLTALMTAFYTGRMLFRAFYGPERVPEGVHAHESGKWMLAPLGVLAIGAVFAGYAGVHMESGGFLGVFGVEGAFQHFLEPVFASTFAIAQYKINFGRL